MIAHVSNAVDSKRILLSTAVVLVKSKNGSLQPCRIALLDSGSQNKYNCKEFFGAITYLATRCLKYLAEQYSNELPIDSLYVKRNFYVDDLFTGANSLSEAIVIRNQIVQLLKLGSFELNKWELSNCPELLEDVSDQSEGVLYLVTRILIFVFWKFFGSIQRHVSLFLQVHTII